MGTESLQVLASDFLAHKRAAGLSPKTLRDYYGYGVEKLFLPWCLQQGITKPSEVTSRVLDRYSSHLQDSAGPRGMRSPATVKTYVDAVNWFLRWAQDEGEIGRLRAPVPKQGRKVLDVLSREEIDAMESAARFERDKVLVRLLADTGMRLGEALGLRDSDLVERGRERYVRVHGKGAQDRLVPVQVGLFRRLQRLQRQRPEGAGTDHLFVGLRQRPGGGYVALTNSGAEQTIRTLAEMAGIERRVYPHLFRHSFATYALNRQVDPITLAKHLGHNSLAMIQRVYSHQTAGDVHDIILKLLREP